MGSARRNKSFEAEQARRDSKGFGISRLDATGIGLGYETSPRVPIKTGGGGGSISYPLIPEINPRGNVTGTVTVDLSLATAHYQEMTLTGNITFVFSNPPADNKEISFILDILQDGTGSRTVTWPASVRVDPTVGSAANARTVVVVTTVDNGTNYDALIVTGGSASVSANTALSNLSSVAINTALLPTSDDTIDLGSTTKEFKDLFIDGIAHIDTLTLSSGSSVTVIRDEDNMSSDSNTSLSTQQSIKAYVDSNTSTQTPWTSNIDADGFDLTDLSNIEFRVTTGTPASSVSYILNDTSGDMVQNVATGDQFFLTVDGTTALQVKDGETEIRSTFGSGTTGPQLSIFNNDSGIVVNDRVGLVSFRALNSTPSETQFGSIEVEADVLTAGVEEATMNFVCTGASGTPQLTLQASSTGNGNFVGVAAGADKIIPSSDGGKECGDATHHWDDVFSETFTMRGSGGNTTGSIRTIYADSTHMIFNMPIGDGFKFKINDVGVLTIDSDGDIGFANTGQNINSDTGGLDFLVPTSDIFEFKVNTVGQVIIEDGVIYPTTDNDIDLGKSGNEFKNVFIDGTLNVDTISNSTDITVTESLISNGLHNLGTTANPWNNIVSDNTLFCSNFKVFDTDSDINVFNDLDMQAGDTIDFADVSTSAGAGARTLPSNPVDFIIIKVNGVSRRVPFYTS